MSAVEDVVTEAPAVEAVPKRAMTLGLGTSLVVLAALVLAPLFVKNFIIFQMTMLLIYGLAVLALNILTGGSGQFSLGQSAFYAVGAYTSAILMEHVDMNYALTLPIAGIICFGFGFLFGQPALRLSGVYLALATFALATAMPQLLKLGFFEHWTGGVQGLVVTKPDAPFGLPMSQDMWLYYFTLVITIGDLYRLGQPAAVALGPRLHGDPRQRDRGLRDGRRRRAVQDAGVRRLAPASPALPAASAPSRCSSWRPTATPSRSRSRCSSAWSSAASAGCRDRSSARAFIIFVPNIAEGISKGLSGAVFGVLLFLVIFLVPHGARQVAMVAQQLIGKLKKN